MEREGGRRRALLPLGGCGSRHGQRRLILVSERPAELARGTVEIRRQTHPTALEDVHINLRALVLQCTIYTYTHIYKCLTH